MSDTVVCWQVSGADYILKIVSSLCSFLEYHREDDLEYCIIFDSETTDVGLLRKVVGLLSAKFGISIKIKAFDVHLSGFGKASRFPDVLLSRLFFPLIFPDKYVLQIDGDVLCFGHFTLDTYKTNEIWMSVNKGELTNHCAGFMLIPPNAWDLECARRLVVIASKARYFEQTALNQMFVGKIRVFPRLVCSQDINVSSIFRHLLASQKQFLPTSRYYWLHLEYLDKLCCC